MAGSADLKLKSPSIPDGPILTRHKTPIRPRARSRPGTRFIREWNGKSHVVEVLDKGFAWQGRTYRIVVGHCFPHHREPLVGSTVLRPHMIRRRCAIYTRKSTEEGLDQAFNSLDAQREACEAFIVSQRHEGWQLVKKAYDDGGFSGGIDGPPCPAST